MAHYRNQHPNRSGPRDWMCKGYKGIGNSRKWWGSPFRFQPPKAARKAEATSEATRDGGVLGAGC